MNKYLLIGVAAIAAVFLPACSSDDSTKNNQLNPIELSRAESEVSANLNGFSVNLLKALVDQNDENKNIAVSPLGAGMVAGMFGNAIADEDLSELTKALGLESNDLTALNSFNAKMLETLPSHDKSATLKLAHGSWFDQNRVQLTESYRTILDNEYISEIQMADFSDKSTLENINSWAAKNTDNAIPTILDELNPYYLAVWVNTMYFKGSWKSMFDKSKTEKDEFTLSDGEKVKVEMMTGARNIEAYNVYKLPEDSNDFSIENAPFTTIVNMDYGNSAFAFSAIMPDQSLSINDFIVQNSDILFNVLSKPELLGVKVPSASLIFPKMNIMVTTDLIPIMQSLGVNNIFNMDYGVNFPGLSIGRTDFGDSGNPYIGVFNQKIKFDVDEEGAIVKVATVGSGMLESAMSSVKAKFDHPFIYFIWEKTTGTILLEGVVMNPNE